MLQSRFLELNTSKQSRGSLKGTACMAVALCLTAALLSCKSRSPELQAGDAEGSMEKPLSTFNEEITSTTKELIVTPGGPFEIPTTIINPTSETWSSTGKYPVTVSYKWFDNGVMLPIEGDRTLLPVSLPPGASVTLTVKGSAPPSGQNLLIKVTMVQEGVAWFMIKGAPALELPARMDR